MKKKILIITSAAILTLASCSQTKSNSQIYEQKKQNALYCYIQKPERNTVSMAMHKDQYFQLNNYLTKLNNEYPQFKSLIIDQSRFKTLTKSNLKPNLNSDKYYQKISNSELQSKIKKCKTKDNGYFYESQKDIFKVLNKSQNKEIIINDLSNSASKDAKKYLELFKNPDKQKELYFDINFIKTIMQSTSEMEAKEKARVIQEQKQQELLAKQEKERKEKLAREEKERLANMTPVERCAEKLDSKTSDKGGLELKLSTLALSQICNKKYYNPNKETINDLYKSVFNEKEIKNNCSNLNTFKEAYEQTKLYKEIATTAGLVYMTQKQPATFCFRMSQDIDRMGLFL